MDGDPSDRQRGCRTALRPAILRAVPDEPDMPVGEAGRGEPGPSDGAVGVISWPAAVDDSGTNVDEAEVRLLGRRRASVAATPDGSTAGRHDRKRAVTREKGAM